MFHALAIAYDRIAGRFDLVVDGTGQLAIDRTAATPLLIAIGTDARAEPDDTLPDGSTEGAIAAGLNARRGWAGDRLADDGTRIGCRLWLLSRAKLIDDTLLLAEDYARAGVVAFPDLYGVETDVAAARAGENVMQLRVTAGAETLTVRRRFA